MSSAVVDINVLFISAGTINSWVVIFILPINSALNPILYTLTTSFFREQVELLLCRWQRRSASKKNRKSLTSSTIYMDPSRNAEYPAKISLPRLSLADMDNQYGWSWKSQWVKGIIVLDFPNHYLCSEKEIDSLSWNNLSKRMALLIPAVFVPIWSALFRHMTLTLMFSPLGEAFLNTSARASNQRPFSP